jgi:hypothetical protein
MDRVVVEAQQAVDGIAFTGTGAAQQIVVICVEWSSVDGPRVHARRLVAPPTAWPGMT